MPSASASTSGHAGDLVIVESPAKIKTIASILRGIDVLGKDGGGVRVLASMGHFRDLAKKDAINQNADFAVNYVVSAGKTKLVAELRKAIRESSIVWVATDEDREGEGIAWHLIDFFGIKPHRYRRVTFNEITKHAVERAFRSPRTLDMGLVDAQKSRRVLDRLVGYSVTAILWKLFTQAAGGQTNLSTGRVQAAVLRLVCSREAQRRSHTTSAFWVTKGDFSADIWEFKSALLCSPGTSQPVKFMSADDARAALLSMSFSCTAVATKYKETSRSPPLPLITSTLQQEAHSKLGYGIASTMKLAQDLYEAGLITYMRTDCSTLSSEFATAAKKHVESTYGKEYLALNSSSRRPPSTKSTAQEAHEAIRPTYLSRAPTNLSPKHSRLYDLIYRRAVASVMAASTYACVILSIEDSGMAKSPVTKGMRFVAKHESLSFAGWEAAHGETAVNGASKAAQTAETALRGASMKACNVVAENKWDTAAARYTEASLVKAMETAGIGRPSTYVSTIKRLLDKSHAEVRDARADIVDNLDLRLLSPGKIRDDHDRRPAAEEKKRVIPTPAGGEIDAFMTQYFPEIADVAYTRVMEARLDEVATGELAYVSMMGDTCNDLATMISRVQLPDKKHALASHSSEFTFGERKFTVREARYGPVIQRIGDGHGDAPQYIPLKGYLLSMGKTLDSVGASDVQYLARLPAMAILSDNIKGTLYIGPYGFYTKNGSDKPTKVVLYKKQLPKLL